MTTDKMEFSRDDLIAICRDAVVPQGRWRDRDSSAAQRQLGQAWVLLSAGCEYRVMHAGRLATNDRTIWIEITWRGFLDFEYGTEATESETFYLPTRARLEQAAGGDWY
ncbi:hypothetical protein [Mycolicibacter heraklionensis]|uniref:hypothetical protein n=1 Tax=Mycolicibacter heraklionensis TaxID=512402 RepID=UPI0007E9F6D5|nr:hypothetical protein [Mycolicibacter heraklionensis]OBG32389.1 hypothetical protein A5671_07605 [Mycolicibacter heraklionensis]